MHDTKAILHTGPTNVMHQHKKFTLLGNPAPGICDAIIHK